jgi:hypothetical protein
MLRAGCVSLSGRALLPVRQAYAAATRSLTPARPRFPAGAARVGCTHRKLRACDEPTSTTVHPHGIR